MTWIDGVLDQIWPAMIQLTYIGRRKKEEENNIEC